MGAEQGGPASARTVGGGDVAGALRASEERFRLASGAVMGVVFDWDLERGSVWRSEGLERVIGYAPEACGPSAAWWFERIHPDDLGALGDLEARLHAPGGPSVYECEYRVRHRDGRWVPVWERGSVVRDEAGRVRRIVGTTTDMTAWKDAERRAQESEARFRAMADSAPVLIWQSDGAGQCTWFNRQWLEFTGRTMSDELGDGWTRGVHPDDLDRCLATYTEHARRREPFRMEYRLRRADGAWRWVLDHGVPRDAPDGVFAGYVGSCVDVTEIVEARRQLEAHGLRLEAEVAERTSALRESHERLRLSERMASLGTLSAGLGHDMGNLLLPVRVRLETLASMALPAGAAAEIAGIRTSVEYLQRLASGLKMLSVDASAGRGIAERTDLQAWFAEAEALMRNVVPRGVRLEAVPPPEVCWARIGRAALTQAVFNLVQNAGDAMRGIGAGRIGWRAWAAGERVFVVVEDTGPGMPEEVKRRCLEPFFTTKARGLSTGLGLTLVYALVTEAGGAVRLASEPGRGTVFTLELARADVPADDAGSARTAVVRISDPRMRAFVTAELRSLQYTVTGEEAPAGSVPDLLVAEEGLSAGAPGALRVVTVGSPVRVGELRAALRASTGRG